MKFCAKIAGKRMEIEVTDSRFKNSTIFRLISELPEPLAPGMVNELVRQSGCSRDTVCRSLRLKRMLTQHAKETRDQMADAVIRGELSVSEALELMKKVHSAPPPIREISSGRKASVYQHVSLLPEPPTDRMIESVCQFCGTSKSTVWRALRLKRLLKEDTELRNKWAGRALTGILSPKTILEKIEEEKRTATRKPPTR